MIGVIGASGQESRVCVRGVIGSRGATTIYVVKLMNGTNLPVIWDRGVAVLEVCEGYDPRWFDDGSLVLESRTRRME